MLIIRVNIYSGLLIYFCINSPILRLVSLIFDKILIGDKFLKYTNIPNNIIFGLIIFDSFPTGTNFLLPNTSNSLRFSTNTR